MADCGLNIHVVLGLVCGLRLLLFMHGLADTLFPLGFKMATPVS